MLGEVIEHAAELATTGELTIDRALRRYQQFADPFGSRAGQVWISVAFLIGRHVELEAKLPE